MHAGEGMKTIIFYFAKNMEFCKQKGDNNA